MAIPELPGEEWIPLSLDGCSDRYEVSNLGRVRGWFHGAKRLSKPRVLQPSPDKYGHLYLNLYRGVCKPVRRSVHTLVAAAFIGPRPPGLETRHLDGNPVNNAVGNLAYGTRSENMRDTITHGTNNSWGWRNRYNKES